MTGQQLKNSILQMAVQGKLVPQDPNDEPASVLLERIRKEKEVFIKEGKIKKEKNPSYIFRGADNLPYEKVGKNEPVCITDEVPFDIPDSWEWCRLSNLAYNIFAGGDKPKDFTTKITTENKYPVIANGITNDGILGYTASPTAKANTITVAGRGTIGFSLYRTYEYCPIVRLIVIEQCQDINPQYLQYVIEAFPEKSLGTSIPQLTVPMLKPKLIPVPPILEQDRICKKIQELIPILNDYTEITREVEHLNQAFPELLKKSILQEAVQGKLVPQDENDEPASVLLERLRAEKQALIKAGKIKKDKNESVIFRRDNSHYEKRGLEEVCIDDELPFEIPKNWQWVKLSDLVQFIGGYAYKSETFIEKSEYQVLRLGNVKNDEIKYSTKPVFISKGLAKKTVDFQCKTNDILITMTGTRLKRDYFYTVLVSEKDTNCFINQRVGCLRCYHPPLCRWLIWTLKSEGILSQVFQHETGTANQGNLGAENIMKTFIPLPPLDEQKRICNVLERLLRELNTL